MANQKPFVDGAASKQSPVVGDGDILLVGTGIDSNAASTLTVGGTTATKVEIGRAGQDVEIKGTLTVTPSISNGVQKKTVTVAFDNAALAAASTNGASATVNIGTALPANARVLGVDMRSLTPFTGGSASAVTADVGSSGDPNALFSADVFSAAVDGGPATTTVGVRPWKTFASSTQLTATFTPDAGHKLSLLTAGSVVIDVLYTVLA